MILFQHNNLQATEWAAIRRELARAVAAVDAERVAAGRPEPPLAADIKLQNVQGGIFESAARIVDYFHPENVTNALTHDLSETAAAKAYKKKGKHELTPLVLGPVSVLSFPAVSPEHLKAALRILAPKAPLWVGSIEGGMSGLRAQIVMLLNSAGVQITSTLEGASKALYLTMESRRSVLEEEAGGKKEEGESKE
ncbi:hypothetical protein AAP_03523 [Ascosphaera apis ARSEF 7405]|uniref:Uncharacterized protein n=1 Tax=Ascosphaera apis ARSEF 7405 TaxID=392613 RepID=A0A162IC39_9EURO|nr:hypothetical protein AAP_03523 [Ascosphaera apis ARSEF 7405]